MVYANYPERHEQYGVLDQGFPASTKPHFRENNVLVVSVVLDRAEGGVLLYVCADNCHGFRASSLFANTSGSPMRGWTSSNLLPVITFLCFASYSLGTLPRDPSGLFPACQTSHLAQPTDQPNTAQVNRIPNSPCRLIGSSGLYRRRSNNQTTTDTSERRSSTEERRWS